MKRYIIIAIPVLLILVVSCKSRASAQQVVKPVTTYQPVILKRDFSKTMPIQDGEKLEYEVKFSKFPISASVGTVLFEYLGMEDKSIRSGNTEHSSSTTMGTSGGGKNEPIIDKLNIDFIPGPQEQFMRMRATAISKGFLIALLGIEVKDRFETLVNISDFSARLNLNDIHEGKKHNIQSILFDPPSGEIKYLTTDAANPKNPPKSKILPHSEGMLSLLGAWFFLRLQDLKEDSIIQFPVSVDLNNYVFDILVTKRDTLKTACGKIKTIKVEPQIFGKDKAIKKQGTMTLWYTDDEKHIPMQVITKTSGGTIVGKLTNFKNNCQIFDPIVFDSKKKK